MRHFKGDRSPDALAGNEVARTMVAYVSTPIVKNPRERRLYFSCRCVMIAARDETEPAEIARSTPPKSDSIVDEVGSLDGGS
jgi:hypothetical protein